MSDLLARRAKRTELQNMMHHAIGIACLILVLGTGYLVASLIAQAAKAAMSHALGL